MLTSTPTSQARGTTAPRLWPSLSVVHDRVIERILRRAQEVNNRKVQEEEEAAARAAMPEPVVTEPYSYD